MMSTGTHGSGRTIVDCFEQQVPRIAENVAIVFEGERVTYGELHDRSNQLAHWLIGMGVGPEVLVAVLMEPSDVLIVAILGILKAGGAYLPLDHRDPPARHDRILDDAQAKIIITTRQFVSSLGQSAVRLVLDHCETAAVLQAQPTRSLADVDRSEALKADHAAYVIYTSGTTGEPKGVVVTHHNVVRLFGATDRWFSFGSKDVWTLFHSCCFDFSVWEIWGALLYGGRLVVVPYSISRSPSDFLRLLATEQVTVLNQTPSAFYGLIRADAANPEVGDRLALRKIIFGGEALEFRRLEAWYRRHPDHAPQLINMYGITETTVHVSYLPLTRELAANSGASLIGESIPDMRMLVLDEALNEVPPSEVGEIYVTGAGVSRGYLNRPELNAQRFLPCPFGKSGALMYRSGDLARRRVDGGLEYLGRADHQLKIRGFRIESGEIVAALLALDTIVDAAVIARDVEEGGAELLAFVVTRSDVAPDLVAMRRALAMRLPGHMIPAKVLVVPALPLTVNGKLDRAALLDIASRPHVAAPRVAPLAGDTERHVASIWQRVLGLDEVGRDDNFFDLGGNSILMLQVHGALRADLGVDVPVIELFRSPKVSDVARLLGGQNALSAAAEPGPVQDPVRTMNEATRARAQRTGAMLRTLRNRRDGGGA